MASNLEELPPHRSNTTSASGSSATTILPSTQTERKMANIIDPLDDSDIAPTQHFVQNQAAHYPQGPYPFSRGNGNFAADQDIQMAQELSHNMQQGPGEVTPTSAPRNNSHGQDHAMDMSQTPVGPGMGPPHGRQSFSGQPGSATEGTPGEGMSGDGKRKRSKVSRACDECRRKKIRCDATDDDGSIKTCSNCQRINQSCSFSRVPMKRGPSKGYIKELSERVQQVESLQMQLAGQPDAYRHSMDSNFSPEEPYSAGKRNFSFSNSQNPFASYPRDRMPSTGGWGISPTTPYQSRDMRGSIALAPDQQPTDVYGPPINYTKPFWAQELDEDSRAAKRQRMTTDDEIINPIGSIEQESLAVYFDTVHHILPILPKEAAQLSGLLKDCPSRLTHAFNYVLYTVQSKSTLPGNIFKNYREVEDYVWSGAKTPPSTRATNENMIWLWTYIFMILNSENDLSKLRSIHSGLSQATLVKLARDLSSFFETIQLNTEITEDSDLFLVRRTHYIVGILSTLHALATGTESPIPFPTTKIGSFDEICTILPDETALISRACAVLAIMDSSIASPETWRTNPSFAAKNKLLIEQHLSFIFASAPQKPELDALCKQIQSLVVILLARLTSIRHTIEILTPTRELANTLLANTTATQIAPKYSPLDIHLFTLTVMTLLEFSESVDEAVVHPAQAGLANARKALEQIAERVPSTTTEESTHWSSCLLRIISAHGTPPQPSKSNGTKETTTTDPNIDPAMASTGPEKTGGEAPALLQGQTMSAYGAARVTGHDGQGDKMMDVKMGVVQVVDMSLLLSTGYLNVVAELCGL